MDAWSEYLTMLRKVAKTLENLTGVQQTKTQAVMTGDLKTVEQCMKQEQAASMTLRGLDQKRERMMDQLGMRGVPLRDIMDHCPPGQEEQTRQTADLLRRQYAVFRGASDVARSTLEKHLHVMEEMQKELNNGEPVLDVPPVKADFRA